MLSNALIKLGLQFPEENVEREYQKIVTREVEYNFPVCPTFTLFTL